MAPRKLALDQARNRYPHRFTMEHCPSWARLPLSDGRYCAPQYASDREWYDNTTFPGEKHIHGNSKWCQSSGQTWPLGKYLEEPYRRAP